MISLVLILNNIVERPTNVPSTPISTQVEDEFFIDFILSNKPLFLKIKSVHISSINELIFISAWVLSIRYLLYLVLMFLYKLLFV